MSPVRADVRRKAWPAGRAFEKKTDCVPVQMHPTVAHALGEQYSLPFPAG